MLYIDWGCVTRIHDSQDNHNNKDYWFALSAGRDAGPATPETQNAGRKPLKRSMLSQSQKFIRLSKLGIVIRTRGVEDSWVDCLNLV